MAPQIHDSARAGSAARRGEYSRFELKLRERWCALRGETCEALSRSDKETYADIAGGLSDLENQSLAEVTRDAQEIRAIERALKRIALGTYGVCVSCGQPIEPERLEAHPTANRCAACQRAYEHDHAMTPNPKL
jgi:DnaK suppressor protein